MKWNKGKIYKNFEVKRAIELEEIGCQLLELEHKQTGAKVMHLANDDTENVFCLSFQTLPDTSNGAAHILEHTVLCGSEKFPVKDPFFAMTRRSLNTFMNAFTGADFTCYPAASQVKKDFYNLLDVYLDAVFRPNLTELSFKQEGHRLEFETPEDPETPLEYKGVVYNEMKGAMSTPDSRLHDALDAALFPDITYGHNSGGTPTEIPNLTYQELLAFHRKYYHPGRCLFFFYGDMPLEGHLDFIEERALRTAKKVAPLPPIPPQPRFNEKKKKEVPYPLPPEQDPKEKAMISFGWLTCHIHEQDLLFALSVISIVLLGTDAAPLKKALLKSGLCKQVSAYLSDDFSEIPLVLILKGCDAENAERLERVIRETLQKICVRGLPSDLVDSAIHQVEFQRSEITGDSLPYGLSLFMRAGLLKQHGGNPEDALLIHSLVDRFRNRCKEDPEYLVRVIKSNLLDNPHFVCAVAKPDKKLTAQELHQEKKTLQEIAAKLGADRRQELVQEAAELTRYQEEQAHADTEVLPKVTLADVTKEAKDYPLAAEQLDKLTVYHHACFTNKIIYLTLVFPLPRVAEEELPLMKLLSLLMPQMGMGGRSYAENLEYIQAHTGGVGASEALNIQAGDCTAFDPYFYLQGKALYRKVDKLLPLLHDMAVSVDFTDRERLKEVLLKHFTVLQGSLTQNAMRYAINLAASGLSIASRIGNAWGGLEYYKYVKELVENFDARADAFVAQLQDLQTRVLCLQNPHLVVTCDEEMYAHMRENAFAPLQDLVENPFETWSSTFTIPEVPPQGRIIASPVAFTTKAMTGLSYIHPDTPALSVAARLFDNLVLHPRLREQGGAYGGGASNNPMVGTFYFYAYRDPNIASTIEAFEESMKKILDGDFDASDLEEAKLEIVQDLDEPVSPGSRGSVGYTWMRNGKTLQMRQAWRDKLLGLTKEDVVAAVKKHILPRFDGGTTVVFAGQELLEKENRILEAEGKQPLVLMQV